MEARNSHAECLAEKRKPELCPVNENSGFEPPYFIQIQQDGRIVYTPSNWKFLRDGGLPAYPNVWCVAGDCTIAMDSLNGRFGYQSGGIAIYQNQRYLLKAKYSFQCNNPVDTSKTTIRPYAVLHTSAPSSSTVLREQSLQNASGSGENLWIIQSDKSLSDVVIEMWFFVEYGICRQNASFTIHSIELLAVEQSYGSPSEVTQF
jgi:hypothetical protein